MMRKYKDKWIMDVFSLARKHKMKVEVDDLSTYNYNVCQLDFVVKERNASFENELCKKRGVSFSIYEQDDKNWKIRMFNRSNLL